MPRSISSTLPPSEGSSIASPSIPPTHPSTPPGSPTQSPITDNGHSDDATLCESTPRASLSDTETLVNPGVRRPRRNSDDLPGAGSNAYAPPPGRRHWRIIIHDPRFFVQSGQSAFASHRSPIALSGSGDQRSDEHRRTSLESSVPGGPTRVTNPRRVPTSWVATRGRRGQTNVVVHNPSPVSLDRTSVNSDPQAHDVDA
ncbi:hypothetical protein DB88DRAFT_480408 [Papiliotrema laurentii]|uniref:Uncharacterized protein n=1 Tax=Papiliotrema laurentii TaxID=5418 RepID=A0AAD9FTV7_PAPLA|nr:hypothetical protein DB88DRAFT_480408 [Papiliotrema laurentii]